MQYALAHQLGERAGGLDPDAKAYILAVEAADGQTLESGVKKAINNFVKGCKSDAIWDAIKASCILAGARTLSGALVPLKGTAPTNFNFVSGDYNRETGLVGNGTSKYLDSNRNNNDDPQNSKHISAYRTAAPTGATGGNGSGNLIGVLTNQSGASWIFDNVAPGTDAIRINAASSITGLVYSSGETFVGVSRSGASSSSYRFSGTTVTSAIASAAPSNENLLLYRFTNYSSARIAFYSIGESIDLEKLDARTSTLMSQIVLGIMGVDFDEDVGTYIRNVQYADNESLESGVKTAYYNFIKGCKSDGIWDAIKASCVLAGARTLSGALVPLKGTAPTNFNFVSGDYNRETGLIGNGTNKYLDSNRNNNADPQNSKHISAYRTEAPTGTIGGSGAGSLIGNITNQNGASWIFDNVSPSADTIRVNSVGSVLALQYGSGDTFVGASRSSSTLVSYRFSGTTASATNASSTPSNENLTLYRFTNYSSARIAFYSIGEEIDLEKLDARVSTLVTDLATAIP